MRAPSMRRHASRTPKPNCSWWAKPAAFCCQPLSSGWTTTEVFTTSHCMSRHPKSGLAHAQQTGGSQGHAGGGALELLLGAFF